MDFDEYLERLASDAPVPGGGSAAAIVAALGIALVAMVARITAAGGKISGTSDDLSSLARRADELREALGQARTRDERAFADVVRAQTLPKTSDAEKAERTASLQNALFEAAEAPLSCAALALDVLQLAHAVAEIGSPALASDVGCAAEFGIAAIAACAYNVRVNHHYMNAQSVIDVQSERLARIERDAHETASDVRRIVDAALGPRAQQR